MGKQQKMGHAGRRKRSAERIANNPHVKEQVRKALMKVVDELAADRNNYYDAFIATWEAATANIDNLAEAYMRHVNTSFTDAHIDAMLRPYSPHVLLIFRRLVCGIAGHELALFRSTLEQNVTTWKKLCEILLARKCCGKRLLGEMIGRVCAANDALLDLFKKGGTASLPANHLETVAGIRERLKSIGKAALP